MVVKITVKPVVLSLLGTKFPISACCHAHCSSFTAELYALLQALLLVAEMALSSVLIITDSASSLQALQSARPSPLALLILDTFSSLPVHCSVVFLWCPSHIGISVGNTKADQAAKQALSIPLVPPQISPLNDVISILTLSVFRLWQASWQSSIHNKFLAIKPSLGQWSTPTRASRREEVVLARLRLGHTRATHGYLLGQEDPPLCPLCTAHATLTILHLLLHCQGTASLRPPSPHPYTLQTFLGDSEPPVSHLLNYLKGTSLWDKF